MLRSLFVLICFSFGTTVLAFDGKSAHREPGESYLNYKYLSSLFAEQQNDTASARSAQDSAVVYTNSKLLTVTAWESAAVTTERFIKLRDVRWLATEDRPDFLRRSSWLYPDDGCFARAALAIMNLSHWKIPVPNKIFVFGNLQVKTVNSPSGSVSWWYHVAPIVAVNGQKYVLDPAIEPLRPLKLEEWLLKMSDDVSTLEVAICQSGSYMPSDLCDKVTDGNEATAAQDQISYLSDEWSRLEDLKRNPTIELGDTPPWLARTGIFLAKPL